MKKYMAVVTSEWMNDARVRKLATEPYSTTTAMSNTQSDKGMALVTCSMSV